MERDLSWAETFKPIDEFQALHMVETATGWPSKKANKWLNEKVRSNRVGTLLRERWGHGKISDDCHKRFKDAGALEQLFISARDLASALDEFQEECKELGALVSSPRSSGTSKEPRPIKLLDGLTARGRVEAAAQSTPEAAQVWLCHALVAGRVRGWRAASAKEACTPELDPTKWPISFSENMPISENGGSLNFYLGKVCVDAESLSEALSSAFPRDATRSRECGADEMRMSSETIERKRTAYVLACVKIEKAGGMPADAAKAWIFERIRDGAIEVWDPRSTNPDSELPYRREALKVGPEDREIVFRQYLKFCEIAVDDLDREIARHFKAPPEAASKGGRPEKDFWRTVRFEAGAWLGHNGGEDEGGSQSALATFLMLRAEAHGGSLGRSQAMSKAKEMIAVFRRLKSEGSL